MGCDGAIAGHHPRPERGNFERWAVARASPQEDTVSRIQSAPAPGTSGSSPLPKKAYGPARFAAMGLALALALVVVAAGAPPSLALGSGPCTLEILVDGRPVNEYTARGASYIEALAGREYAVRLTNRSDRRIAVALSVDGLNSIDAKTTSATDATKWVLGPYESITIDGWQTSAQTARKFFFTTETHSYGAWLGKTRNLGVIAAAVFREKLPKPQPLCGDRIPCPYGGGSFNEGARDKEEQRQRTARADAPAAAPDEEPSAPSAKMRAEGQEQSQSRADAGGVDSDDGGHKDNLRALGYVGDTAKRPLSDELAATGIGREMSHRVIRVPFETEDRPATLMEVRYEYRDALVRLGVLRCFEPDCGDRLAQRERSRGFTDGDFAPDPYRGRR
jgi:hypothetical protein